jgi:hypothetical protein
LLKNPSQTAAIEPVLVRRASTNEVVESFSYTGLNFSNSVRNPLETQTSTAPSTSGLASTGGTYPAQPPSWTALSTQSMSVLSGIGEIDTDTDRDLDLIAHVVPTHGTPRGSPRGLDVTGRDYSTANEAEKEGKDYNPDQQHFITRFLRNTGIESNDQSFESFHTPPSSPRADGGNMSNVFVTPPPSPDPATAGTTAAAAGLISGLRTPTPPCATLRAPSTTRPLGLNLDFLQINCGKRISAMALLETNVKNKIALIQEPYTSINGCTLIHKRDFFSSGTATPSTTPGGAAPATSWTSSRPRAEIYAPGRTDVLPVYRFMTRDIATVAVQLGFISSIYMDITKSVRSKELLALLDFCRQEDKTLIMAIYSNSHSYLFSDCENNRGLELESLVA